MRFVFGIIVGCLLTVGAAYVHDAAQPGPAGTEAVADEGRMVNWAVVDRNVHGVNGWVQAQWTWVRGQFNHG